MKQAIAVKSTIITFSKNIQNFDLKFELPIFTEGPPNE
jgi:hypothetical protein